MGIAHYLEHKMFDTPDGGNALQTLSATGAFPQCLHQYRHHRVPL